MSEVQEQLQAEQEGSTQDVEAKVLKKSGIDMSDNTYKLDLRNAVQKQSTDEVPVREGARDSKEVVEEIRSSEESAKEEGQVIELIKDDTDELHSQESAKNEEQPVQNEVREQKAETQLPQITLPENIQHLVDFMNETGGSMEDYVRLNADYSNIDETALLREYYRQTKPHLTSDEVGFLLEDSFDYDEDLDSEKEIRKKKLAYKEEINKARGFLSGLKDKYYKEVKNGERLTPEAKEAIEFYKNYTIQQHELTAEQQRQSEHFTKVTDQVFNEDFKGFDFNVGDNKFRYKVNDAQQTKKVQSNIVDAFKMFLNEDNTLKDAKGYHKALFAARNADSLASHFYEQGKADAIRQLEAESKNINMNPRRTSDGVIETGGMKYRVISGDDSSKLKVKFKN